MKPLNPIVIYHDKCPDGFAAAWCFHRDNPDGYDFYPATYGSAPPDVTGRQVFLVDFSYKRDVLLQMAAVATSITILDHHKSAQEDLDGLAADPAWPATCSAHVVFDMNRSGAGIAWDYLFPTEPRPDVLACIEDRDLWLFKRLESREVHAAVNSRPFSFPYFTGLMQQTPAEYFSMIDVGRALLAQHNKHVADVCRTTMRRLWLAGHTVPVANVPGYMASDAGHLLSENEPFAATYYDTADKRNFSLRSRPEGEDVSAVARAYGGGGHKHAAGFSVPRGHLLALM